MMLTEPKLKVKIKDGREVPSNLVLNKRFNITTVQCKD